MKQSGKSLRRTDNKSNFHRTGLIKGYKQIGEESEWTNSRY